MLQQGHASVSGQRAQVEEVWLTLCCSKHDSLWLDWARSLLLLQLRCPQHHLVDKLPDLHQADISMPSMGLQATHYA